MRAFRVRWAPEFAERFEVRKNELLSEPVVRFIQDLRRAAQHSKLPPVSRVITFDPVPPGPNTMMPRTRLMVETRRLLELLSDWSLLAREFIETANDHGNVDMASAVKQYHQVVWTFDDWCIDQVKNQRKDLLDDFDQRRAELRRLQALSLGRRS